MKTIFLAAVLAQSARSRSSWQERHHALISDSHTHHRLPPSPAPEPAVAKDELRSLVLTFELPTLNYVELEKADRALLQFASASRSSGKADSDNSVGGGLTFKSLEKSIRSVVEKDILERDVKIMAISDKDVAAMNADEAKLEESEKKSKDGDADGKKKKKKKSGDKNTDEKNDDADEKGEKKKKDLKVKVAADRGEKKKNDLKVKVAADKGGKKSKKKENLKVTVAADKKGGSFLSSPSPVAAVAPFPAPAGSPSPAKVESKTEVEVTFMPGEEGDNADEWSTFVNVVLICDNEAKEKKIQEKMNGQLSDGSLAKRLKETLTFEIGDATVREDKVKAFDLEGCASHVEGILNDFSAEYTPAQVPDALSHACDQYQSSASFSHDGLVNQGDENKCRKAVKTFTDGWEYGKKKVDFRGFCHDVCKMKHGQDAILCDAGKDLKQGK